MSDIRHRSYNPQFCTPPLLCEQEEADGFALVRVVGVTEYEFVAVFERSVSEPAAPSQSGPTDSDLVEYGGKSYVRPRPSDAEHSDTVHWGGSLSGAPGTYWPESSA